MGSASSAGSSFQVSAVQPTAGLGSTTARGRACLGDLPARIRARSLPSSLLNLDLDQRLELTAPHRPQHQQIARAAVAGLAHDRLDDLLAARAERQQLDLADVGRARHRQRDERELIGEHADHGATGDEPLAAAAVGIELGEPCRAVMSLRRSRTVREEVVEQVLAIAELDRGREQRDRCRRRPSRDRRRETSTRSSNAGVLAEKPGDRARPGSGPRSRTPWAAASRRRGSSPARRSSPSRSRCRDTPSIAQRLAAAHGPARCRRGPRGRLLRTRTTRSSAKSSASASAVPSHEQRSAIAPSAGAPSRATTVLRPVVEQAIDGKIRRGQVVAAHRIGPCAGLAASEVPSGDPSKARMTGSPRATAGL